MRLGKINAIIVSIIILGLIAVIIIRYKSVKSSQKKRITKIEKADSVYIYSLSEKQIYDLPSSLCTSNKTRIETNR